MTSTKAWVCALTLCLAATDAHAARYDMIIAGGDVYDGTGASARKVDIAVRGDRIVAIGELRDTRGVPVIDARGLAVAPGSINMMSQAGDSLLEDGRSQSDIRQGVTLEFLGEGVTPGPGSNADTSELIAPASVAAEFGGIYVSHIRDESDHLVEAVEELITVAREAKVPAEIFHLKAIGVPNWPSIDRVIARVEAARAAGVRVSANMYPYTASGTGFDMAMPPWVRQGGDDAWIKRSRMYVAYFMMSEDNLRRQIQLPWMSFGSDGESAAAAGERLNSKVHPRSYGSFARVIGHYVRDEGVISLSEAIRRLSGLPASTLGLRQRGTLRVGNYADIVVFDPRTVGDRVTFENPHQYSQGMDSVFVNGVQVLKGGEHTGARPGRYVRVGD